MLIWPPDLTLTSCYLRNSSHGGDTELNVYIYIYIFELELCVIFGILGARRVHDYAQIPLASGSERSS